MRKMRDTPSEGQLELKFEDSALRSEFATKINSNVVRVQFGIQKPTPVAGSKNDRVLIERILESAQKLKW